MMHPFDRYEVDGILGFGQSSRVFSAKDTTLDRFVAIKLLKKSVLKARPEFRAIATREARCLAALRHTNIVPLYDFLDTEGGPVLIMGYGRRTLKGAATHQQPLPVDGIAAVARQVASAIDYCTERGLAHRDIKPSNVVLDEDDHVFLADFGTAVAFEDGDGWGHLHGTLPYIGPELLLLPGVQTGPWACGRRRCDQFSFGVLLYQLLTGTLPLGPASGTGRRQGAAPAAVPEPGDAWQYCTGLRLLMGCEIAPCSCRNPALPQAVDQVIGRLLARNPDHRYESATAAAAALESALAEGAATRPLTVLCLAESARRPMVDALRAALAPYRITLDRFSMSSDASDARAGGPGAARGPGGGAGVGAGGAEDIERRLLTADALVLIAGDEGVARLTERPEWRYWLEVLERPVLSVVLGQCRLPFGLFSLPHLRAGDRSAADLAPELAVALHALAGPGSGAGTGAGAGVGGIGAAAGAGGTGGERVRGAASSLRLGAPGAGAEAGSIRLRDLLQVEDGDACDAIPFPGFACASDMAAAEHESGEFPTILRTSCGLARLCAPVQPVRAGGRESESPQGIVNEVPYAQDPRVEWRLYGTAARSRVLSASQNG